MCLVTDKIKFCTCKSTSVNTLKHYWILHRYNKHKNIDIVGMFLLSEAVNKNYADNKKMLQQRINAADVFDFTTDFKAKDILEITLKSDPKETEENTTFYFQFKKDKWRFIEHDVFSMMNDYDELHIGKLKGISNG